MMRKILGRHRDIAAFGEAQLVNDVIYRQFPTWIAECPGRRREFLLRAYRRLCLTRFYRCRATWRVNKPFIRIWNRCNLFWIARFQDPESAFWRNPVVLLIERAWLSNRVQERTLSLRLPGATRAQVELGYRGLYPFMSRDAIEQSFGILDALKDVTSIEESHRICGRFWSAVFASHARRNDKKLWAEKSPLNALYVSFLDRCFSGLRFINVIRDGRDVACSNVEYAWGAQDVKSALDLWAQQLASSLTEQRKLPPDHCMNVRYEDLVLDTAQTIRHITDFLGVPFDDAMLSQPVHRQPLGRHRSVWNEDLEEYARSRHAPLLREWGYL